MNPSSCEASLHLHGQHTTLLSQIQECVNIEAPGLHSAGPKSQDALKCASGDKKRQRGRDTGRELQHEQDWAASASTASSLRTAWTTVWTTAFVNRPLWRCDGLGNGCEPHTLLFEMEVGTIQILILYMRVKSIVPDLSMSIERNGRYRTPETVRCMFFIGLSTEVPPYTTYEYTKLLQ